MEQGGGGSVRRGFDVLDRLAAIGRPATATEIAATGDASRVHTSRILTAFEGAGVIEREAGSRAFALSRQLFATAKEVTRARLFREGPAVVEALAASTGEAAFVVELRGASSVTVLEAGSPMTWAGRSYPAYCDDGGQALLFDATPEELAEVFARTDFVAYGPRAPRTVDEFATRLDATRSRGYSVTDEEVEPGVLAVAAPVRDFTGRVVFAIHVEGPRERMGGATPSLGALVLEHAATLSRLLGHAPAEV